MNFFKYWFDEPNHRETIWLRRPFQKEDRKLPLILHYAGYSRCSAGWQNHREKSDIYAIEYVSNGDAFLVQEGKEYVVNRGEVFILRKDTNHTYGTGPAGFLLKRFIAFDGMEVENLFRMLGFWGLDTLVPKEPKRLDGLIKQVTTALSGEQDEDADTRYSTMIYNLLVVLAQSIESEVPLIVEKALGYLQRNLAKSLTRRELADYLGVSVQSCNNLFFKYFGCSPIKYFIDRKMNWAMQLVRMTRNPMKEIAAMVGYDDPLYFSSQFKKRFGLSPMKCRELDDELSASR